MVLLLQCIAAVVGICKQLLFMLQGVIAKERVRTLHNKPLKFSVYSNLTEHLFLPPKRPHFSVYITTCNNTAFYISEMDRTSEIKTSSTCPVCYLLSNHQSLPWLPMELDLPADRACTADSLKKAVPRAPELVSLRNSTLQHTSIGYTKGIKRTWLVKWYGLSTTCACI